MTEPTTTGPEQAPTRDYAQGEFGQRYVPGRRVPLPFPLCPSAEFASSCPPMILDSDPTESGLGLWALVESGGGYCTYEYVGGIA